MHLEVLGRGYYAYMDAVLKRTLSYGREPHNYGRYGVKRGTHKRTNKRKRKK